MKRSILLTALLAALIPIARGQISGAGNIGCSGTAVSGTVINSSTSNNTVVASLSNFQAWGLLVQLDQTSTITGGAVTFQESFDGGANYISVPVAQVLNVSTFVQLTNPYTLVASTNQSFLITLYGATNFQVKLTTAMTGTGAITPYITAICSAPQALVLDSSGNQKINIAAQALSKVLVTPDALPANQSVNVAQVAGTTTDTNSGTKSAGTQRVVIATDQPQLTNKLLVTPDPTIPEPSSASGDAVSACNILSTASTNATSCKGSAGNFYGYEIYNNTTTIYYLRLYNSSSSPTCSSATGFIRTIPIPPASSSGQAGGAISNQVYPTNYSTGIGYCITGGSSSTDNTNAAAGVFGEIRYK